MNGADIEDPLAACFPCCLRSKVDLAFSTSFDP